MVGRRSTFSNRAPARASDSRVAPISSLVSRAGGPHRRNALADATNFASHFDASIRDVEAQVACHDKPNYSFNVLDMSERAFDNYLQHLAVRELQCQGLSDLDSEQVAMAADAIQTQIQSRELSEPLARIVDDRDIWVSYLHIYAMTGRGQIDNITIEHTSVRNRHPSAAAAAAAADDHDDHGEVDGTDEPDSGHVANALQPPASFASMNASASSVAVAAAAAPDDPPQAPAAASTVPSLPIDPRLLDEQSASNGDRTRPAPESIDLSRHLEEERGPQGASNVDDDDGSSSILSVAIAGMYEDWAGEWDDDDDDYDDGRFSAVEDEDDEEEDEEEDDDEADGNDDESDGASGALNAEELRFASAFSMMPGATPLALNTIKSHLDNILRHFSILKVTLRHDLRSEVLKIVKYLARQRGMYPTGKKKKYWIDDSTIAALEAAIWSFAGHLVPRKGARSVANLLSLQLIVMFLDEFGSRVTSWLDVLNRRKGEVGRYLRWGMVTITFCGYSGSGNDPEFVLNVSNSANKKAGRCGDLHFTVNTMATRMDRPKSRDPVFCLVALGVVQHVFRDDVARIFSDRTYGSSLLRRNRSQYVITAKDEFVDCPVFLHGRVSPEQPDKGRAHTSSALTHPSDRPARGQHHRPMSCGHLTAALGKLSRHLGLTHKITSRTFRTSFAFKNVLQAKIPAWRLAARMGHFSGNKALSRHTYAPTYGPVDTRRTADTVDPGAAFSDGVREALAFNGAIAPLPDADDIDPAVLARARRVLRALESHLEHSTDQHVPTAMADEIVDTFRSINTGVRIPFKDSLAGLLSLSSIQSRSSSSLAQPPPHPFDDEGIRKGSDAALLKWLVDGGSLLCPSCHESLHSDEVKAKHSSPSSMFLVFNDCLKQKHAQYCCFICSQYFPLSDGTDHAVHCFRQHYDACCADGLDFDQLCVLRSSNIERWKKAHFFVCPIASCIDQDWYQGPGADDRSYLYGTAHIQMDSKSKHGPEIGGGKLQVHPVFTAFADHLAAHFFDTALVSTSGGRAFQVRPRMPETIDGTAIICPVRNCSQRWEHDSAGETSFLAHLINVHKLPILFDADGQTVVSIDASDQRKLANLLPYLPETGKALPDVEVQRPDRRFDGFYIRVVFDLLKKKAEKGSATVKRTSRVPPALRKKLDAEERRRRIAKKTVEELAAANAAQSRRWRERYHNEPGFAEKTRQKARENDARRKENKTEEELAAQRARERQRYRERYQNEPAFAEKKRQRVREHHARKEGQKENKTEEELAAKRARRQQRIHERCRTEPGFAEKKRQRAREQYAKRRARMAEEEETVAEPSKRKRQKENKTEEELAAQRARKQQRATERYRTEPGFAEKKRQRARERYRNDPDFAEKMRQRPRNAGKRARTAEEEETVAEPSKKKKKKAAKNAADEQPQAEPSSSRQPAQPSSSRQTRSQTRRT